jgi:hypothetical protein
MKQIVVAASIVLSSAALATAGPASGTVTARIGTIAPKFSVGYTVRDMRNPRSPRVEVLLTEVNVAAARVKDDLDPHVVAINLDELRDRNYLLLWVSADGTVSMNATYSRTMTQYINDTGGGLKADFTTNTPTKIEGRVYSAAPFKTMDGETYTIDVKFSADVVPPPTGTALTRGGGEAGKALTAFIGAITKKNWAGIKAGLSPNMLPMFEKDYNTAKENLDSAVDILNARLPLAKSQVTGGIQVSDTVAILELEGERFGSRNLSLVRMVKNGAAWQFDQTAPLGSLR